jgi:hypothetical protein
MSKLLLRLAGDATVRATITADAQHVFSVYDFMDLACPTQCDSWTKIQNVTLSNTKKRRFRQTPVMTLEGLQGLLVILGGKVAADLRQIVKGTFTRYMAGDTSMIEEIRSNAASSAPVHQAYHQALAQEPVTDTTNTKAYT